MIEKNLSVTLRVPPPLIGEASGAISLPPLIGEAPSADGGEVGGVIGFIIKGNCCEIFGFWKKRRKLQKI